MMRVRAIRVFAALCCLPLLAGVAPSRSAPRAPMWDLVRAAEWDLTVRGVERRIDPLTTAAGTLVRPDGHFALLAVDLTNRTEHPLAPTPGDFVPWFAEGGRSDNLADSPVARTHA